MKPRILLDCDTGIDDAVTLLYLAAQVKASAAELVAVGTVHGNVAPDIGALNTLRVLELAGLTDIPVAKGAARPMAQDVHYAVDWHGVDGLGNTDIPAPQGSPIEAAAPEQIIRLAKRHPGELTLVAIGPLTNLGIALLLEPSLPSLLRSVVIMGGAFDHPGNVTSHAEANVWHDPEAAELVFAADWPVVLVPLDATHPTAVDADWLDTLAAGDSETARFASRILEFYTNAYTPVLGSRGCVIHDALAAMLAVDPSIGTYESRPVRVELRGEGTRGTTLWDRRRLLEENGHLFAGRPLVQVVTASDVTTFQSRLLATLL